MLLVTFLQLDINIVIHTFESFYAEYELTTLKHLTVLYPFYTCSNVSIFTVNYKKYFDLLRYFPSVCFNRREWNL